MKQYYLIKQGVKGVPVSIKLAERYIERMVEEDPWFLIPLGQIITTLSHLKLNSDGEIQGLKSKINHQGDEYYCVESKQYQLPNGGNTKYEVLKKINSTDHVYEIRIKLKHSHGYDSHCRILMTINVCAPYFVWTYGFTKQQNIFLYAGMTANRLTDVLATVTHRVFRRLNSSDDSEYVGKDGERHEV